MANQSNNGLWITAIVSIVAVAGMITLFTGGGNDRIVYTPAPQMSYAQAPQMEYAAPIADAPSNIAGQAIGPVCYVVRGCQYCGDDRVCVITEKNKFYCCTDLPSDE